MKIDFSVKKVPLYSNWQQARLGIKAVYILTASALLLFLVKKAFAYCYYKDKTLPPAQPPALTVNPPVVAAKLPQAAHPAPARSSTECQLVAYLQDTLYLPTEDDLSRNLGTRLAGLAERGITTLSDLECLRLDQFLPTLKEFEKTIDAIDTQQTNSNLRNVNNQISLVIESIQEFMNVFTRTNAPIQTLCAVNTEFNFTDDITKIQTALTALKTTCAKVVNRSDPLQVNKTSLSGILTELQKLDNSRQVCWLKGYLLQQDLIVFWNKQPYDAQNRSLSVYQALQKGITLEDLFQLGARCG